MPDPVFDPAERVAPPAGGAPLPAELQGRTPQQVAQYYQQREQTILANAQAAIANGAAGNRGSEGARPSERPAVSSEDFERDPVAASRDMIARESVSRNEWNQMTGAVQNNLIESAKFQSMQGKKYWNRLWPVIEEYTRNADGLSKLDSSFWTTAYNAALGASYGTIQQEEAAAAAAATASLEAPSGGSTPPEAPRVLNAQEMKVVEGLGITADLYRKGEINIRDNKFPITLDNRRRV